MKRARLESLNGKAEAIFNDFSSLQSALDAASAFQGVKYSALEPERQFLIEKDWNYFGLFSMGQDGPVPVESFSVPDSRADFLEGTVRESIVELASSRPRLAIETASKFASSRLLRIPVSSGFPESPVRIFIENVLFSGRAPIVDSKGQKSFERVFSSPVIDFSGLVSLVCSEPVNNLGFETMNCGCCVPDSIDAKNILPSGRVNVRFLKEGFYFNSCSKAWANSFHESNDFRESRQLRKEEYGLSVFPSGPFSRGMEKEILLGDARRLQMSGDVEIISGSSYEWVCSKVESALSKEINSMKSALDSVSAGLETEKNLQLNSSGLLYYSEGSCEKVFGSAVSAVASEVLCALPHALRSGFGQKLGVALEAISGAVASDLESIASSAGSRFSAGFCRAAVEPEFAHYIFREFSGLYNVKKPLVRISPSFD